MKPKRFHISRRDFVKRAAVLSAATGLPAWFLEQTLDAAASTKPLGPNDKPNVALIGCGGQGRHDTVLASKFGNIVAVCDVDAKRAEAAAKQFAGAKIYKEYRELLQRDDLHAIVNGTPDHWHTFINIAAMKAGKDVYSEKPLTLTIDEGRRLVETAKKTKRILQTGSQQRSDAKFRLACELVRNGRVGKLRHVDVVLPAGRHGGPFSPSPVPPELDWNTWQGQAPQHEYVRERCHQSFRYWYDYSGGTMTDWGAHHNDIALWGIGLERSGPISVEGKQLVEPVPGGFTAASEYKVEYAYGNGVTHTCQSTPHDNPSGGKTGEGLHHGVKFEGTDGWIFVTRGKIEASKPELLGEPLTNKKVELYTSDNHMGNFFDCLRSRQQPICDAEIGHRSISVCHLGVIAIRLGRKLNWDPAKEQFVGDREANGFVAREQRKPFTYDMV
jgi:predicted dehydrogenase